MEKRENLIALVVDDSPLTRKLVSVVLKNFHFQILQAESGMHALEIVPHYDIHLIVTDLNMPTMDGLEFLRTIRRIHQLKNVPVVVLSSVTDEKVKKLCYSQGVQLYLTKPLQIQEMQKALEKLLKDGWCYEEEPQIPGS